MVPGNCTMKFSTTGLRTISHISLRAYWGRGPRRLVHGTATVIGFNTQVVASCKRCRIELTYGEIRCLFTDCTPRLYANCDVYQVEGFCSSIRYFAYQAMMCLLTLLVALLSWTAGPSSAGLRFPQFCSWGRIASFCNHFKSGITRDVG